jgi:hypothetical protein
METFENFPVQTTDKRHQRYCLSFHFPLQVEMNAHELQWQAQIWITLVHFDYQRHPV